MKITFRDIVWIAIIALVVVFLSKCHRDATNKLRVAAEEITRKALATDSAHAFQQTKSNERLRIAELWAQTAAQDARLADERLRDAIKINSRLAAAVKASKDFPIDTSFVEVSPEYVSYCDSLAVNSENLDKAIETSRINAGLIAIAKDSVINTLKETISSERDFSAECRKEFTALQHFYSKSEKAAAPRRQIYAGAELIGTQYRIIQNVGGVISLKTKGNKLWQISSGLQGNGQVYGRISGSVLISFRK